MDGGVVISQEVRFVVLERGGNVPCGPGICNGYFGRGDSEGAEWRPRAVVRRRNTSDRMANDFDMIKQDDGGHW